MTAASVHPPRTAAELVDEFLRLIMMPDAQAARRLVAPDLRIGFTAGRLMRDPADGTTFNARRYRRVKKRSERSETVAGATPEETVVYSLGTLHGEWPDSAEWLLVRVGLAAP